MYKEGSNIVLNTGAIELINTIPVDSYNLIVDAQERFCLVPYKADKLPEKIYGNAKEKATKFLNSYKLMTKSMGVLLSGYKGSGKSLMGRVLAVESGLPIIYIHDKFEGSKFISALNSISQEVVVIIEELEKTYKENPDALLALLDGVGSSKKIFIFTANSLDISEFLLNRLGRVRYHLHYESLEEESIREVIDDYLENKEHATELLNTLLMVGHVSYDNVIGVIQEMNVHNISPIEALNDLNISVTNAVFDVLYYYKGFRGQTKCWGHPLAATHLYLDFKYTNQSNQTEWVYYYKPVKEMTHYSTKGKITMEDGDGNKFVFKLERNNKFKFGE